MAVNARLRRHLIIQFRTRRYVPWVYWLAVTAVSIFGTMSADFLNKDLGMPLWASTLMLPAGDFAAGPLGLDILASTFVFLAVILVPAVGYKWLRLNEVLAFWFAYTITRPLGASFADWLSVPAPYGDGLQLGTGPMSLVFGIVLAGVIAVIVVRHRSGTAQNPPVLTAASPRWLT